MSNPNKAKGTAFETAIVRYLHERGFTDARRVVQTGPVDTGDVHCGRFCFQAKNWRDTAAAMREGTDGAMRQKKAAGLPFGVAVVKRHRANVSQAYAIMPLEHYVDLMGEVPNA